MNVPTHTFPHRRSSDHDEAYPQSRRNRRKFREDSYAGGNLFALMGPNAHRAVAFWARMEARRKRPWHLARALGPVTLAAYISGPLSLGGDRKSTRLNSSH